MMRTIHIITRLFFGGLALIAVGAQFIVQIQNQHGIVNFFSFFTNLIGLFAGTVLLYSAVHLILHKKPSVLHDSFRGAAFVYTAIVGLVFALLLRHLDQGTLLPWVNNVLHYALPVFVAIDYLYQPPTTKLPKRIAIYWLLFPVAFLAYSLIRGALTNFYPYPFLNPANGGYLSVGLYCAAILILFFVVSRLAIWLGNSLKHKTAE